MAQPPQGYQPPPPAGWVPVYYAPQRPPISGLAVAGFVFALTWAFGIASAIGVILCIAALRGLRDGTRRGTGLAATGLAIGIIGAIVGIPFVAGLANALG